MTPNETSTNNKSLAKYTITFFRLPLFNVLNSFKESQVLMFSGTLSRIFDPKYLND